MSIINRSSVDSSIARRGSDAATQTIALMPGASAPGFSGAVNAVSAQGPAAGPLPMVRGYVITGSLGAGGMGTVWRAKQLSTRREVALKLLSPALFNSAQARRRFDREVELTAKLEHPNVARVYESGVDQGVYFYAMELVEGVRLDAFVREGQLTFREILTLMELVCDAVQHAHQRGVIHRDLKPSNILVTSDRQPKVLDFGVAKAIASAMDGEADDNTSLSMDGHLVGTPAFMSPEQALGKPVDTRSDVYSLGVMLYWLLVGRGPFERAGASQTETVRLASDGDIVRPRAVAPTVDRDLEVLLLKALAKTPDDRYVSAAELAQDLRNYLAGDPLNAKRPTLAYFVGKRVLKHRVAIAAAAALLVLVISGGIYAAIRIVSERNVAIAQTRAAKVRLGESLLSEGDALGSGGRWGEAKDQYAKGYAQLGALGESTFMADFRTWNAHAHAAPPLASFTIGAPPRTPGPVRFCPDGRHFLCGRGDGSVLMFDVRTGSIVRDFGKEHQGALAAIVVSPDGKLALSIGGERSHRLLQLSAEGEARSLPQPRRTGYGSEFSPAVAAFSLDGRHLVVAETYGQVTLWHLASAPSLSQLKLKESQVNGIKPAHKSAPRL